MNLGLIILFIVLLIIIFIYIFRNKIKAYIMKKLMNYFMKKMFMSGLPSDKPTIDLDNFINNKDNK